MAGSLKIKRIYEMPAKQDGYRVLVERLWPRGLTKDAAALDLWLKDVAPSHELRKWYGHVPDRWPEFKLRYRREIAGHSELIAQIKARMATGRVTLLFAAKDEERNSAVVLRNLLVKGD